MLLLDTSVASALRLIHKQPPKLREALESLPLDDCFLSVITILEAHRGVALKARHDPAQAEMLQSWWGQFIDLYFPERILIVDQAVARRCALLHVPDPRPQHDALIAATALVHDFTVVTRNVSDFAPMGVALLNPWEWEQ